MDELSLGISGDEVVSVRKTSYKLYISLAFQDVFCSQIFEVNQTANVSAVWVYG